MDNSINIYIYLLIYLFRYAPILNLMPQQRASLTIIQTSEYKELEIISFDMIAGDEDIIRQHATYKYGCVKAKF